MPHSKPDQRRSRFLTYGILAFAASFSGLALLPVQAQGSPSVPIFVSQFRPATKSFPFFLSHSYRYLVYRRSVVEIIPSEKKLSFTTSVQSPALTPQPAPSPTAAPSAVTTATPRPKATPRPIAVTPKPSPSPTQAPAAPAPAYSSTGLTVNGVFNLTNQQRTTNGVPTLRLNDALNKAAAARVQDMIANGYFSHQSPDGKDYVSCINNAGYAWSGVAENIADGTYGYLTDSLVMDGWMNSSGHRANILNSAYRDIGVGVGHGMFNGQDTWFAVQLFGTPR